MFPWSEGGATSFMPTRLSVRWRLLLAFLGISAFAVLAAGAGTYAFRQMAYVIERITEQRVPSALTALDLSRQAERIVAAAPTLLNARSQEQYREISAAIRTEVDHLEALLSRSGGDVDPALSAMEPPTEDCAEISPPLPVSLPAARGLGAKMHSFGAFRMPPWQHSGWSPRSSWCWTRNSQPYAAPPRRTGPHSLRQIRHEITENLPMQKAQLEFAAINDGLLKVSLAENPADIAVLTFPLNRSLSTLRQIAADLTDPRLRARFEQRTADFQADRGAGQHPVGT